MLPQTLQAKSHGHDGPATVMGRANPLATRYDFYLTKELKCDENVMSLIVALKEAGPHDQVFIHLNSPGGFIKTMAQVLTAIRDSQAHVVTCAEGEVASAAAIIFFAGHSFSVSEFSNFMLHNVSGGAVGEVKGAIKDLENAQEWGERMFRNVLEPFFSEDELNEILEDGRDHYYSPEEIAGRIDRMQGNLSVSNSRN